VGSKWSIPPPFEKVGVVNGAPPPFEKVGVVNGTSPL